MGAGTGIIGEKLASEGFQEIHGVDASESFVESLKQRGNYKTARALYLGYGKFPEEGKDAGIYDFVTASGVFLASHMPKEAIPEIVKCLKPGGHFVTAMRSTYYVKDEPQGYFDTLDSLCSSKQLELVKCYTFMRGMADEDNKAGV